MEILKVGICLEDRAFARALAAGLARETSFMHFYLLNSIREGDFCDMILSSAPSDDKRVVELTGKSAADACLDGAPYRVYRYRESQNLINDLLFIYFKMTGKVIESRGRTNCRILMFLADSGGCGTTATALATGAALHRIYGSRILYLSLCPFDDSKKNAAGEKNAGLLKLLYYLEQKKDFPVEHFITKDEETDYVNTSIVNTYFNEMKPSLLMYFLEKIDRLKLYDFLIVDIGNHLSRENKQLLAYADFVVVVSDGERKRSPIYREHISQEIHSRMEKGKLIRVENFSDDLSSELAEKGEAVFDADKICISRYAAEELQLQRNYGMEIGIIAREIMEGKGGT